MPNANDSGIDIGADEFDGVGMYNLPIQDSSASRQITVNISPNPFTSSTFLSYTLDKPSSVSIAIYNHYGQLIEKIEQEQPKGEQQVQWNAEGLPAGLYIIRLQAGNNTAFSKLLLAH